MLAKWLLTILAGLAMVIGAAYFLQSPTMALLSALPLAFQEKLQLREEQVLRIVSIAAAVITSFLGLLLLLKIVAVLSLSIFPAKPGSCLTNLGLVRLSNKGNMG